MRLVFRIFYDNEDVDYEYDNIFKIMNKDMQIPYSHSGCEEPLFVI